MKGCVCSMEGMGRRVYTDAGSISFLDKAPNTQLGIIKGLCRNIIKTGMSEEHGEEGGARERVETKEGRCGVGKGTGVLTVSLNERDTKTEEEVGVLLRELCWWLCVVSHAVHLHFPSLYLYCFYCYKGSDRRIKASARLSTAYHHLSHARLRCP